jgi:hypothetical protein
LLLQPLFWYWCSNIRASRVLLLRRPAVVKEEGH